MAQVKSGFANLRPRARLIGLIGQELISDEPVAIVELVKNAYDADATWVRVSFQGINESMPERIVVEDDGNGMDLQTVLSAWFEPGTTSKRSQDRSPGGRLYLGAKGIGRFASARLAENLALESTAKNSKKTVFALFDWGAFDDNSYLDEVQVGYEEKSVVMPAHGTRLTMEKVRKQNWTRDDFEKLHSRLARLLSPFEEVQDFRIELEIPNNLDLSGQIEPPELLHRPKYQLNGSVSASGTFTGRLRIDGKNFKEYKQQKLAKKDERPLCGGFTVEIRGWDRDREGLSSLIDQLSMNLTQIRKELSNYSGVSIYRDGFRVHPYGEPGNDWLQLDNRSRQNPVRNLANNQIVAAIKISREDNPALEDRSTREGMVINEAHGALEEWFKFVLSLLEEERYRVRPRRETNDRVEPLFETFDLRETAQTARKELGKEHPVAQLIVDTEKQVRAGVERVQEVFSRLLMSAGVGQMVDLVIHEISAPAGKVSRELSIVERQMAKQCDPKVATKFSESIKSIKGWMEQIYNLRTRLDPQTAGRRGRATTFDVLEEIRDTFNLYEALLERQGIKHVIKCRESSIKVRMARGSLSQILANLLDNSLYWIIDSKGEDGGGEIAVRVTLIDSGFRILFADNGPGVEVEDQSRIFEPYFSTRRGGSGMGLGLYISRLLIEPYGKLTYLPENPLLGGACFDLHFERKVGR